MDCIYKGVHRQVGGVGGGSRWAEGKLYPPIGLFGASMSPRSAGQ